jgi:hypothetical protein
MIVSSGCHDEEQEETEKTEVLLDTRAFRTHGLVKE